MRLLNEKREEISESDADLSKGYLYTTRVIKPDATPVDDIEKFAYTDDDYEAVQIYERIPDEILIANRIEELKKLLSDTDYIVIKIAEGVSTAEEYSDTIANRQLWREEINSLEKEG